MIEPFSILDPKRQCQTRRKVQLDCAPPSLPQHEREQGEPEDERVREDDENCHCNIGRIQGKEGSIRKWLTKSRIRGGEYIKNWR
jgi:hypothetical protein